MVKLIIFDVCWTMYKSNTTFDFIKYVYKVECINSFKLIFLNSLIVKFSILLLGKLVGRDIYRELFVKLLKGFSKERLQKTSEKYFMLHLSTLKPTDITIYFQNIHIVIKKKNLIFDDL